MADEARRTRGGPAPAGPPSRRRLLGGVGAAASLGLLGALGTGAVAAGRATRPAVDPRTEVPLFAGTVAHDVDGVRVLVGGRAPDLAMTPGTRLAAALGEDAPARARAADFAALTSAWRERLGALLAETGGDDEETALLGDLADSALADL